MAIIGCIDGGKDDVFFSYVEVSFIIFLFWFIESALLGGSFVQIERKIKFLL